MKNLLIVLLLSITGYSHAYTVDEEILKKCIPKDILTAGQRCNPSSSEYSQEDKWNCSPICSWYKKRIIPVTSDRNVINASLIANQIRMLIVFNTNEMSDEDRKNTFVTLSITVDKNGRILNVSDSQTSKTKDSLNWSNAVRAAILDRKNEVTILTNSIPDKQTFDITFRP